MNLISLAELKSRLLYVPDTGQWTWLRPASNRVKKGSPAGTRRADGRLTIGVDGGRYLSSRLAIFYMTGEWPSGDAEHRDLDRSNDRWNNLRPASRSDNMANVRRHKNNRSGYKGVWFDKRSRRYVAEITKNYRKKVLGYFPTATEAHAAYAAAAASTHGEYARTE